MFYDGISWSDMVSNTYADLNGVWGNSATDVYAAGTAGTILHYDGTAWSAMTSNTTNDLKGIWGTLSNKDLP